MLLKLLVLIKDNYKICYLANLWLLLFKEINHGEVIGKCKPRRLLLLNDLLVCVSVNNKDDSNSTSQKRLTFKWSYPISEIQVYISSLLLQCVQCVY